MIRLLFIFMLICPFKSLFGQYDSISFPMVKQGKWSIVRNNQVIKLDERITELSCFDEFGRAFFHDNQGSGIIDEFGHVIYKTKSHHVQQLSNGAYAFYEKKSIHIKSYKTKLNVICKGLKTLSPYWYSYTVGNDMYIMHTNWEEGKKIPEEMVNRAIEKGFDYLFFPISDSIDEFYDPHGVLIESGVFVKNIQPNFLNVIGSKTALLIDAHKVHNIPRNAKNFELFADSYTYSLSTVAYLIDRETDEILFRAPGDKIVPFYGFGDSTNYSYYAIMLDGLIKLTDLAGKTVLNYKYTGINPAVSLNKPYYYADINKFQGLLDADFKEVIPCKFNSIERKDQFFLCHTDNNKSGLYNSNTFEELLLPIYSLIIFDYPYIKAYENDRLTYIKVNNSGKIETKLIVDNIIPINNPFNYESFHYDKRLLKQGWFFSYDSIRNQYGDFDVKNIKWGLRLHDSIVIKPIYNKPKYIKDAQFNAIPFIASKIAPNPLVPYAVQGIDQVIPLSIIMNNKTGRRTSSQMILSLDTNYVGSKKYWRFFGTFGAGIINSDGVIKNYAFVETNVGGNATTRVCQGKEIVAVEPDYENTEQLTLSEITLSSNGSSSHYEIPDGKWNCLDNNGLEVFETPYDYIGPFYLSRSIVRKGKKYGVINPNQEIVPTSYSNIAFQHLNDTYVFKVQLIKNNKQFMDTSMRQLEHLNFEVTKKIGENFLEVKENSKLAIIDSTRNVVLSDYSVSYTKTPNRFVFKRKKQFEIRDNNLRFVGQVTCKPKEFLCDSIFTFGENQLGLARINGDTIVPEKFESIVRFGTYYILQKGNVSKVIQTSGEVLKTFDSGEIVVDRLSNSMYHIENLKAVRYSSTLKKSKAFTLEKTPLCLINSYFFLPNGTIIDSLGNKKKLDFLAHEHFKHFEYIEAGYLTLEDEFGNWFITDLNLNLLTTVQAMKHVKHIEGAYFTYTVKGELYLTQVEEQLILPIKKVIGKFESDLILVKDEYGYCYLNRSLENEFDTHYLEAKPFGKGYSVVKPYKNWGIMNREGVFTCSLEYDEVTQHSDFLFEIKEKPYYGLLDLNGNVLIEPKYERLFIMHNGIIQVYKNGQINYFDLTGKLIL